MDWDKLDKKKLAGGILEAVGGLGGAAGDAAMPGVGTGIRVGAGGIEKLVDLFMPDAPSATPAAPAPAVPIAAQQPAPKRSRTRGFDAPIYSRPRNADAAEVAAATAAATAAGELVRLPDGRLALVEQEQDDGAAPAGSRPTGATEHIIILRKPKSG